MGDDELELLRQLRRASRSRGRGGRQASARSAALRAWERLERRRTELPPMPLNWHPGPPEFEALDEVDSIETRERWWAAIGADRGPSDGL